MAYARYDPSVAPRVYGKLTGIEMMILWDYSSPSCGRGEITEQMEVALSVYKEIADHVVFSFL